MSVNHISLVQNGPVCSRLALGFWRTRESGITQPQLAKLVMASVDLGITTFDHADIYGDFACEQRFGQILESRPSLRTRIQIITKCGIRRVFKKHGRQKVHYYDSSKAYVTTAVEQSLQRLRTDYVDILLLHRPDPLMNADELTEALTRLNASGKVLHIGVSNFSTAQFELLRSRVVIPLVTNQIEFSLSHLAPLYDGTLEQCQRYRISPMAWSPLGGSRLFHGRSKPLQQLRKTLRAIGRESGATIAQIALAWILKHPSKIIPVLGTSNIEHLREAARCESFALTREQWFHLWSVASQRPVP